MNEWKLIERIKEAVDRRGAAPGTLVAGIGDDCAVFDTGGARRALITTDISVEGVHFDRRYAPAEDIGYRSMIANISDIAAMGGEPLLAFVSLGIPAGADERFVLSLYEGFHRACEGTGLRIAGGDLSAAGQVVISIALYGEAAEPVLRSGARPGDAILVTGTLGDSRAGLEILAAGGRADSALAARHLRPPRRIDIVPGILERYSPTAMIDVSDGLLSDLRHLCQAGGTGFLIDADSLPRSPELAGYCDEKGADAADYALGSGEEYELLFTSRNGAASTVSGVAVTPVGTVTEGGFAVRRNGTISETAIEGYEHFAKRGDR